jgi:hypothetical protein
VPWKQAAVVWDGRQRGNRPLCPVSRYQIEIGQDALCAVAKPIRHRVQAAINALGEDTGQVSLVSPVD